MASFVDPFVEYKPNHPPKTFKQLEEKRTPEVVECMKIVDERFGLS